MSRRPPHPWSNTHLLSFGRQTIDGLAAAVNTISLERGLLIAALVEIAKAPDLIAAQSIATAVFDLHPHLRPINNVTTFKAVKP